MSARTMQTSWQGRRDSNTQPTVLETATLPLSHSPVTFLLYRKKNHSSRAFFTNREKIRKFLHFPDSSETSADGSHTFSHCGITYHIKCFRLHISPRSGIGAVCNLFFEEFLCPFFKDILSLRRAESSFWSSTSSWRLSLRRRLSPTVP